MGRRRAPRERSACAESGERSRPHPAEPIAGAPQAQIPRNRGATDMRRPIFGGGTSPVRSKYPMTTSDIGRPLSVRFVRRNVS